MNQQQQQIRQIKHKQKRKSSNNGTCRFALPTKKRATNEGRNLSQNDWESSSLAERPTRRRRSSHTNLATVLSTAAVMTLSSVSATKRTSFQRSLGSPKPSSASPIANTVTSIDKIQRTRQNLDNMFETQRQLSYALYREMATQVHPPESGSLPSHTVNEGHPSNSNGLLPDHTADPLLPSSTFSSSHDDPGSLEFSSFSELLDLFSSQDMDLMLEAPMK